MRSRAVHVGAIAAVVVAGFMVAGCPPQNPIVGGPCEYTDTVGTARIVSIETAPEGEANCTNDPVVVVFDFTPTDAAAAGRAATGVHLTLSGGLNPPRSWVEAEGLTVGSDHPAVRSDITTGTCTPIIYALTDVDEEAGLTACYAETPVGGDCEYADTVGTARIVSIEAAPEGEANCANDPVVVVFDFTPTDAAAAGLAATGVHLTLSGGLNPPRSWVEAEGLTVGSDHPAVRSDITTGTCTPTLYELTDVDEGAGVAACN